jgi:hypothetical protein
MRVWTMLENRRACPVAEQHASIAIRPIDDGRKFFGADDQHGLVRARHNELLADFERINEPGTGGFDVEGGGPLGADFLLHEASGRRKRHVGRDGGDDDQIDLLRRNVAAFHRAHGGLGGHVRGILAFGGAVRVTIHSSVVSTIFSRSAFLSVRLGT